MVDNSDGIYAKRDVYYRNYQYEPDDKALQAFRKPEKVIEETSASGYSEAYWDANRQVEVSKKETSVDKMMAQLRSYPVYFWTEKVLKVLFTGYIPALNNKEVQLKVTHMKNMGTYAAWRATKTTGQYDAKTFEVKAVPSEKVEGLRPGMSVLKRVKN